MAVAAQQAFEALAEGPDVDGCAEDLACSRGVDREAFGAFESAVNLGGGGRRVVGDLDRVAIVEMNADCAAQRSRDRTRRTDEERLGDHARRPLRV